MSREGEEGRKEKGKEKGKKKRREWEKRKKRKRKSDAGGIRGGIRGVGRELSVASTRSDAHEKRGEQGKFKRYLISVSGRRFDFWCPGDELPDNNRARR